MKLIKKIKEFFTLKKTIQEITISEETIQKICGIAKDTHPKEFLAFLEGRIIGNKIIITDILFQPYIANKHSTWGHIDLPLTSNVLGSIHSHPSYSNTPSRADLHLFGKTGIVHGIIKKPYSEEDIQIYDNYGNKINHKKK
ncbi:Mov34/MPN/PAD-1 family protein [Candidatus Woesearchaeota archaeon]|nr:Mov34/MPN/PAD-1 family protein [Candidatus Woesearchaeota archaeon]MCF7900846.1 Mov34/MPN/PAD-1 family protein [Candidatus Woesearchaeota archaeon]MCF8013832.1 Mov34/MPN/PAD-1 family protein [Candidatus Woesearchaeota archaeon]